MCCVPEPWPERGSMVRWPICCREWSMCLNISTSTWAYPRSDSSLRGNYLTGNVCAYIKLFLYMFCLNALWVYQLLNTRGLVPCSSSLWMCGAQFRAWSLLKAEIFQRLFSAKLLKCGYSTWLKVFYVLHPVYADIHTQYKSTQEGSLLNRVLSCQHFFHCEWLRAHICESVYVYVLPHVFITMHWACCSCFQYVCHSNSVTETNGTVRNVCLL